MFRVQDRRHMASSAADLFRDSSRWDEVHRDAACRWASVEPVIVVYRNGSSDCVEWFDSDHPFFLGVGPHWLGGARYYRYRRDREHPVRPAQAGGASAPPPTVAPPPRKRARQAPAPEVRQKTWIEIELLDEKGAPVPSEPYSILLPDGSTRTGNLDALGRARVDDIDPGMCEISFPEIDRSAWRAA
jgi:hypothetical protein